MCAFVERYSHTKNILQNPRSNPGYGDKYHYDKFYIFIYLRKSLLSLVIFLFAKFSIFNQQFTINYQLQIFEY